MASSWTSKTPVAGLSPDVLRDLRHRGWRGGWISPHRAFAYLPITLTDAFTCTTLVFSLTLGWIHMLKYVSRFWDWIFRYWNHALGLDATVLSATEHWGSFYFSIPYLNLAAGPPDPHTWWITGAVTLGVLAATYFISEEHLPWIYILRFLVLIQGSALIYFVLAAARFPHDLPSYTVAMLNFGTILIGLVPAILGLTYYLFDFNLFKKVWLTLLTGAYLAVFIPLQYIAHVYILQKSILFMPLLYFVCGPFLDVLIFVGLYSWAMSWKSSHRLRM